MTKKNATTNYSFTYNEVEEAYKDCEKHKKNTNSAIEFSMNKLAKLMRLCDEINNNEYEIGKSTVFVVKYPVYREIFAADFRDRIVHHLVIKELMPFFEEEFEEGSFSCRKGKGVMYGANYVYNEIKKITEDYTKDAWVLKMDVKSFFMSIDKQLLADMVDDFIVKVYPQNRKKEMLRILCNKIILHHPEENYEKRGDLSLWDKLEKGKSLFDVGKTKGLPIGNLTSQIFANFYLNKLDKYIRHELGFKHYGRYVDDFVIISDDKEKLKKAMPLICKFAKEKLNITIHPNKRYLQHYSKGLQFIGCVLKKGRKYVIKRTVGSLYYKITHVYKEYKQHKLEEFMMCVNSYLGVFSHSKTYKMRKKLLTSNIIDEWRPYINIDKDYKKITLKDNPQKVKIENVLDYLVEDDGSEEPK